eukprot:jgi/Ulvmu1/11505/UM077_0054.1
MLLQNLLLLLAVAAPLAIAVEGQKDTPNSSLPAMSGPGRGALPRWFHKVETGECKQSSWGGCKPNGNDFEAIEECTAACEDICELEKKVGPCKAKLPRWFHNADTGECEPFDWGGCQPNANNFESLKACEAGCQSPDTCSLPLDSGDCLAATTFWGYGSIQGGCVEFLYTGCGGNANRFPTEEQCVEACG